MDIEELKPIDIKSLEKFEQMTEELLKRVTERKEFDNRTKLLGVSIKKYMIHNDIVIYGNKYGELLVIDKDRIVFEEFWKTFVSFCFKLSLSILTVFYLHLFYSYFTGNLHIN